MVTKSFLLIFLSRTAIFGRLLLIALTNLFHSPASNALCFNLNEEIEDCARVNGFPSLAKKLVGYNFGYGSLNETEKMCQTKFHIKIIQCVRERSEEKCGRENEPHFLQVMWSFTLDTKRHERAAAYICRPHNLRIFRHHKELCLRELEPQAEKCSRQTDSAIHEVVEALKNQSEVVPTHIEQFHQKLRRILVYYECKAMRKKFDCLYTLLTSRCPIDAVELIMNYFIESLPDGCHYQYRGDQMKVSSHSERQGASAYLQPDNSLIPATMQGDEEGSPNSVNARSSRFLPHVTTITSASSDFGCHVLNILFPLYILPRLM
ncbi:hypothetical protein AAHC03_010029 [Spirometra sp. Aus1]